MTDVNIRLYEIKWHYMINEFFRYTENPTLLYEWVEVLSGMFNCNYMKLRKATQIAVTNAHSVRPRDGEQLMLMVKDGMSIRAACRDLQVSTNTYYTRVNQYEAGEFDLNPKYPEDLHDDMIRCIQGLIKLTSLIN